MCGFRWVTKDGIGAVGRLFIGLAISYKIHENQSYEYASNSCLFIFQVEDLVIFLMMILNNGGYMQTSLAALEGLALLS